MGESSDFLNVCACSGKSIKDCLKIGTVLHGDDSKLIFLINPNKEGLFLIMEDTSSIRPIPIQTYSLKEPVSLLEEEMIINELLSLLFSQFVERVVGTGKVPSEA